MSWNVHGLKHKLCDTNFIEYVKSYDIIFLGETWLNKRDTTNLDGYLCEHIYGTKSVGARRGRKSGGISLYYKSYLKDKIAIADSSN